MAAARSEEWRGPVSGILSPGQVEVREQAAEAGPPKGRPECSDLTAVAQAQCLRQSKRAKSQKAWRTLALR